ncbi:MAG: tRNA dihydrouridine synthase DusB [Ponticaulis sp.]|nr:tRNA dihydrouridine synthase DusB [Ponticaulis sp.]|tara:strand:- start:16172 stop:17176 length:1005 start_codon:yes stop_codon:yes gene_type:complete
MGLNALFENDVPVFLAPMSGVTDAPFRKQVLRFGAKAAITEMVAGEELIRGLRDAETRLKPSGQAGGLHIVQLVGREAEPLRLASELAAQSGADVIDINMGCPSRRVTGGLSGSALMRDLDHAERLIEAVLEGAGRVPVTLKMRMGWDWKSVSAPELAARAERLGVQMITVHGRTRQDFYEGAANWPAIREVKSSVSIPLIANGDIVDFATAQSALRQSDADGVMIGRAATGRAWLIADIEARLNNRSLNRPSFARQMDSLLEQASDSIDLYGLRIGSRMVRKHLSAAFDYWVDQGFVDAGKLDVKKEVLSAQDCTELTSAFEKIEYRAAEFAA